MTQLPRIRTLLRQPLVFVVALLLIAVACAREVTAPSGPRALRYAHGISFVTQWPSALRDNAPGNSQLVEVSKVRVVLLREDGSVALDTLVSFPEGSNEISLNLSVGLSPTAPSSGEPMSMALKYLNSAGDTVFKGTAPITATAVTGTSTPPAPTPVTVNVTYTGKGSNARAIRIADPRQKAGYTGDVFEFTAVALDGDGAVIPNTPIKWSSLDVEQATITSAVEGKGIMGTKRGTARIVAETLTGLKDTVTIAVQPRGKTLAIVSGNNQTATVTTRLPQSLLAKVSGDDGLGVSGVSLRFAIVSGGGNLTSADVVTDVDGVAKMDWVLGSTAGQQVVTVTGAGLTGSPLSFNAIANGGAPVAIEEVLKPASSAVAGAVLAPVSFRLKDQFGNTSNTFTGPVTVALAPDQNGATLTGTLTANAVAGVATFSTLSVTKVGGGYKLVASASGLPSVTGSGFSITPASGSALSIDLALPATIAAGDPSGPFTVTVRDPFGNAVPSFTGTVTLTLTGGTSGATLVGSSTTATAVAGVATFGSLSVTRAGKAYVMEASAQGFATGKTTPFDVKPAAASIVAWTVQPRATTVAGTTMGSVEGVVMDSYTNVVSDWTAPVSISLGSTANGATLGGTVSVTPSQGTVKFNSLVINKAGTTYRFSVSSPGLNANTSSQFAIVPATATSLAFTAALGTASADAVLPSFSVVARDAFGNTATDFVSPVTLSLSAGVPDAALSGTITATPTLGTATFNAARIVKAGTGYALTAAAGGVTSAVSGSFEVTAGAPAVCAAGSATNQNYFIGAALPLSPSVTLSDANGNPLNGKSVSFVAGAGTAATPSASTNSSGAAASAWTLGTTIGTQTMTATCTGVSTPVSFTVTAVALGPKLKTGSSASLVTASVAAGQDISIPIVLDLSFPNGENVASASFDILFDPAVFTLQSTATGPFGSVLENVTASTTGKLTVGVFSPTKATATTTVYTVTLRAKSVSASTTSAVTLNVTAAGREDATNVVLLPRNLTVTITP